MLWNLATIVLIGAGNYLGPDYFGLPINLYSNDPIIRMKAIDVDEETLRQMQNEFRRFWMND
jgi:hypothetical protein